MADKLPREFPTDPAEAYRLGFTEGANAVVERLPRDKPSSSQQKKQCAWVQDEYVFHTDCGRAFEFIEGGLYENDFHFCYGCGLTISEKKLRG